MLPNERHLSRQCNGSQWPRRIWFPLSIRIIAVIAIAWKGRCEALTQNCVTSYKTSSLCIMNAPCSSHLLSRVCTTRRGALIKARQQLPSELTSQHCAPVISSPRTTSRSYVVRLPLSATTDRSDIVSPTGGTEGNASITPFPESAVKVTIESNPPAKRTFLSSLQFWKNANEEGLTVKQKLAKLGVSALLSYGFVSNVSYSICISIAWYGFTKKTQLSPLAPGQWPKFLAVYAGFWAFNNVVRPARFACSMLVTPYFDRTVSSIQRKLRCSKGRAIGIVVFLANFCGTLLLMSVGIFLAASASGVPIFPKRA